jgi:hypothetical protein
MARDGKPAAPQEELEGVFFRAPVALMRRVRQLRERDAERVGVVMRRLLRQGLQVEMQRRREEESGRG